MGVARSARHRFSKEPLEAVLLVAGHGVEGDAHAGATVQHLSRTTGRAPEPHSSEDPQ